jgi:hypothetical protein
MRPWGPAEWLLQRLPLRQQPIIFVGCLAAEERSTAMPVFAHSSGAASLSFLRIKDPPSRFASTIESRIRQRQRSLEARGIRPNVVDFGLFAPDQEIADSLRTLMQSYRSSARVELWLDITAMPKRFFFLLIKLAVLDRRIETLIVFYCQPAPGQYTPEHLAEDPEDVRPLPGFGPTRGEPDSLILALGFEALGLPQLLGEYRDRHRRISVLLPFPPGQPYSRRIWATLRSSGVDAQGPELRRVNAVDAFDAYFQLSQLAPLTDSAVRQRPPALAPYGPKPVSAAMCLYALDIGSPVFYTQPRVYHPDYTLGTGRSWAYCFKLFGKRTWR